MPYYSLLESMKKNYCIALIFLAAVKSSSLFGRDQQMDDSFLYTESFMHHVVIQDTKMSHPFVGPNQSETSCL